MPAFTVAFKSGATVERFKPGEQKQVDFIVNNYGKEVAEDVRIMFFFPPQFSVLPKPDYMVAKQSPPTRYPGYEAAGFEEPVIHIALSMVYHVTVEMPDRLGQYEIPVSIRARRIGKTDHKVSIEITG